MFVKEENKYKTDSIQLQKKMKGFIDYYMNKL